MNICTITVSGNITREPELKYTQNQKSLLSFGLAVNHDKESKSVSFFEIALWGKFGEAMQQYLHKGTKVAISGNLRISRTDNGTYANIDCRTIDLLSSKQGSNNSPTYQTYSPGNQNIPDLYDNDIPF